MKCIRGITFYSIIGSLMMILFGCSSNEEADKKAKAEDVFAESKMFDENKMSASSQQFGDNTVVNIDFSTMPKSLRLNQSSALAVDVTSEGKAITDAEVVFEIWQDGQTQSIQVNTKSNQKGTYTLKGKFSEPGKYNLIAHVDALNRHEMKTFQFVIQ